MTSQKEVLKTWTHLKNKIKHFYEWVCLGKEDIIVAKTSGIQNTFWTVDLRGISYKKSSPLSNQDYQIVTDDLEWLNLLGKLGVDWQPPEEGKSFFKIIRPTSNIFVKKEAWIRGSIEKSEEVKVGS